MGPLPSGSGAPVGKLTIVHALAVLLDHFGQFLGKGEHLVGEFLAWPSREPILRLSGASLCTRQAPRDGHRDRNERERRYAHEPCGRQ